MRAQEIGHTCSPASPLCSVLNKMIRKENKSCFKNNDQTVEVQIKASKGPSDGKDGKQSLRAT